MTEEYSRDQKATVIVALITAFVTTFTGSALNLSIPNMGAEFSVSASFIGWVVTAYMLAVAALSVPFGRLADLTNRKIVLITGILVFGLTSLVSAFAWNIMILIFLRAAQGIGGAMIFSTNTATLISAFPGSQRGKVLGYSIGATYIGLSAGPVVGGILNHYLGWRSIFLFTFALTAVVSYIAIKRLPASNSKIPGNFDMLGNLVYVLTILFIMYGLSTFSTGQHPFILIGIGICLLVFFVLHEKKARDPIINVSLFARNATYTAANIAALLNYGATFAIGYLLSIYLQVVMGYTSQIAGMILIIQPLIMAAVSPTMGKFSDKYSPHKLSSIGMGLCALSLSFFVFITETTPLAVIILALVIAGIGFGVFSSPNTNAVMACVDKEDYGVASSVLATMRSLGHTSSMAIVTVVVGAYMGSQSLSEASPQLLIDTMHTAFIIFTGICLLGIFIKPLISRLIPSSQPGPGPAPGNEK